MVMTPDPLPTKPPIAALARQHLPAKPAATAPGRENLPAKPAATLPEREESPPALAREDLPTKRAAEGASGQEDLMNSGDARQPPSGEPPDQQRPRQAERTGEQYLRLRVRVDNEQLSIVDSQLVDGPLTQTTAFQGRFAYEVTYGGRLLHAGSIPDLGTVRSFAHPNGTLEQRGHHTYELSSYEFDARVSAAQLQGTELSKISIALYRVKQPARPDAPRAMLSSELLAVQREQHLREIGRVVGVPAWALPSELHAQPEPPVSRRPTAKKTRSEEGKD